MAQWLELWAPNAGIPGLIPGWGTRSHIPQLGTSKARKNKTKQKPGADCGSDHELFIAKFRLKLKKGGKTTRSFRYDLNQFPYTYTVEVTSRFKGLDLIDRMPEELWMEVRNTV